MTQTKEEKAAYHKAYYAKNRERIAAKAKLYYAVNKEQIAAYDKIYYAKNKEEILAEKKLYQASNKEKIAAKQKEYRATNKEKIAARNKLYKRKQYADNNLSFLIPKRLRSRLYKAIKNNYKSGSAVIDLGCSIAEFRLMMEFQFTDDMTWENWGTVWHLDHIIPLSFFNLEDVAEFKVAVHYSNLQPLMVADNLKKGSSLPI